jgi:hypothetical protein
VARGVQRRVRERGQAVAMAMASLVREAIRKQGDEVI